MLPFIRDILQTGLKDNKKVKFAVITGCLKISKESIFTGLNNLSVYSMTSYCFADGFGFTKKEVINLYQLKPYKGSSGFNLMHSGELGEANKIENYFPYENEGFIVYKNGEKFKMKIKGKKIEEFEGLYDFDSFSGTLVLFKEDNKERKIGIYYSNGECKSIYCHNFITEQSIVEKIMLIPCIPGYEKQSLLLFSDKKINVIKLRDSTMYPQALDLPYKFDFKDFHELQFIIYLDFLLILKFNKKRSEWNGKVFSLCLEDESLFELLIFSFSFMLVSSFIFVSSLFSFFNFSKNSFKYFSL